MKKEYAQVPHYVLVETGGGNKYYDFNKYVIYSSYIQNLIRKQYPHLFKKVKRVKGRDA